MLTTSEDGDKVYKPVDGHDTRPEEYKILSFGYVDVRIL
jgi:hypothetical protein